MAILIRDKITENSQKSRTPRSSIGTPRKVLRELPRATRIGPERRNGTTPGRTGVVPFVGLRPQESYEDE
jgi:hypothetical protein